MHRKNEIHLKLINFFSVMVEGRIMGGFISLYFSVISFLDNSLYFTF